MLIQLFFTLIFIINLSNSSNDIQNPIKEPSKTADVIQDRRSSKNLYYGSSTTDSLQSSNCNEADIACLTMASHDRLGLEAIKALHSQLDDDEDGDVDLSESDDFLREELKYDSDYERRQKAFHYNDDKHISVRELWEAWLRSEVHNWTVEQTTDWLVFNVGLPQYIPTFVQHQVTGATLPRLAVNNMHYLSSVLGVKDPIHKQKIALKAMDVVLFGPPKEHRHGWKDVVLMTSLIGALIVCWYTYKQHKNSKKHLSRMMRDMESLHKAEIALEELQKELERARMEQENVTTEKQNLEKKLQEANSEVNIHASYSDVEITQLKAEIEMLRSELQRAEGELEDRCWSAPISLQHWLQLTYELESKTYMKKKMAAEKQLQQAREACEKLRKKRTSLVGAFVSTHGKSIDDVDRSIVEARTSLNEVTHELQERVYRWKQVELLCGFSIVNNNGLQYLENMLYNRSGPNGRPTTFIKKTISSSQDDLDEDTVSQYGAQGFVCGSSFRDDSSGSDIDVSDRHMTSNTNNSSSVHFVVGSGSDSVTLDEPQLNKQSYVINYVQSLPKRSISNNNISSALIPYVPTPIFSSSIKQTNLVRSQSQDTVTTHPTKMPTSSSANVLLPHTTSPKNFHSESNLVDSNQSTRYRSPKISREASLQEQSDDLDSLDEDNRKRKQKKNYLVPIGKKTKE